MATADKLVNYISRIAKKTYKKNTESENFKNIGSFSSIFDLSKLKKILSKNFIRLFGYKIINIHPSLLPKFKGLNTHKKALENKEKYSGCTVHFVAPRTWFGKNHIAKKSFYRKKRDYKFIKIQNFKARAQSIF